MDDQPRLYTLNEASETTGLSVDALRQRIKRGKLRSVRGNDGLVRIRLSPVEVEALVSSRLPSHANETATSHLVGESSTIRALQGEAAAHRELVQTLRDQLERAQADADVARAALVEARERWEERLDRLASEMTEERRARAVVEAAHRQLEEKHRTAQAEAAAARDELAQLRARGWLARLLRRGKF
jgi:hypothetical protein